MSVAWEWQFVDSLFADDENSIESEGYAVSNLRLGYRHTLGKWEVAPYLGINNLFDVSYNSNVRSKLFPSKRRREVRRYAFPHKRLKRQNHKDGNFNVEPSG